MSKGKQPSSTPPPETTPPVETTPSDGTQPTTTPLKIDTKAQTAKHFFSAYAQTWVGMSPIWLMGEAITGRPVGTQFLKGKKKLVDAAQDVRRAVSTSAQDVVVIVDEKLMGDSRKEMVARTAEVIKAAGENAILVVTTSLEKLSSQLSQPEGKDSKKASVGFANLKELANDPSLRSSLKKHSRDALVLLDDGLKQPVVVTGVAAFARSRGIPHPDALLRLASLGLARILRAIPEEVREEASDTLEAKIEEIDAEELERRSSIEERQEAELIGKAGDGPTPKVEGKGPYEEFKKKNDCIIM